MNVLFLSNGTRDARHTQTIYDHISAFVNHSRHRVFHYPYLGWQYNPEKRFSDIFSSIDLSRFDAVALHSSLYILQTMYLSDQTCEQIRNFKGRKIIFLQDEYRRVNDLNKKLIELGFDVLFSCFYSDAEMKKVYSHFFSARNVEVEKVHTGYVLDSLVRRTVSSIRDRPIDVGYRARKNSFALGALAAEKWQIAEDFMHHSQAHDLNCDISIQAKDLIRGPAWFDFLSQCKAILGTESGASVIDFTGEIEKNVEHYVARHSEATFAEVQKLFFKNEDGVIVLNAVSPRIFEAAALRTGLVLFEGTHSNVVKPWQHYFPLKKDWSNFPDLVAFLKNPAEIQAMVDRAYQGIARNPLFSYGSVVQQFDRVVDKCRPISKPYNRLEFQFRCTFGAVLWICKTKVSQLRTQFFIALNKLPAPFLRFLKKLVFFKRKKSESLPV